MRSTSVILISWISSIISKISWIVGWPWSNYMCVFVWVCIICVSVCNWLYKLIHGPQKQILIFLYPPNNQVVGGYIGFSPSVRLSVRLSRLPCPLCNIYSSGWILSILATNDHYYEGMCRTEWPLTLTYIFKVIWLWLRKSCPLCSVYISRWILFIYGTNDHYH